MTDEMNASTDKYHIAFGIETVSSVSGSYDSSSYRN